MSCEEVIDFLSDYLDRTLSWRERAAFAFHLALCRDCRRYLASYRATVQAAHAVGNERGGADLPVVPDELVQAILKARRADTKTGPDAVK